MTPSHDVEMRLDVKVPMRDGVDLSADIYLPRAHGKFPTLLMRTPYSNNTPEMIEKGRRWANRGYACVIQDTRGRWDSDGHFYPFHPDVTDGFDTQEWVGSQEWSTGKIGMAGGSYLGLVQWFSAPLRSQYLTALAPRVICGDFFTGFMYPGGAFQLNVAITWGMRSNGRTAQSIEYHNWADEFYTLPLIDMDKLAGRDLDFWKDWLSHPTYDDYWEKINVEGRWDEIAVPSFNMSGWFDIYPKQALFNFNGMRQHGRTPESRQSRVLVGPWTHSLSASTGIGEIDFGADSMIDLDALELRWYDYWLKGIDNGVVDEPPVRLFIMGVNHWRDEHEWPLARTEWQKWYLHSGGNANGAMGDGALAPQAPGDEPTDQYTYDPRFPVQTSGGATCCSPHIVPWGPRDQRVVESRGDVLCYTSAPLEEDTEVTGPIKVVLYAATDGPDTDWTAKLVDVWPSGYAMNLYDGIIRARYRESLTDPTLLEPNRVYEYEIDVGVTANVFRKGHSIRLEVSSSNFPRFDRNLNTGHPIGMDAEMRTASQTVHHSREYPSHIVLPIIPAK